MKKVLLFSPLFLLLAILDASGQRQHPVLNHIAIYVKDLKRSTDFYQNIIQLDTIPEPFHDGKHTWFSIGSKSHLHVIQGASDITLHDKNAHICFSVASVTAFIVNLDKAHVPYEDWPGNKQ